MFVHEVVRRWEVGKEGRKEKNERISEFAKLVNLVAVEENLKYPQGKRSQ